MMSKEVTITQSFYEKDLSKKRTNLETRHQEKNSILEKLVSNKTKTLKSTVKALAEEIKIRERLHLYLLNNIDDGICRQHTMLMGIDRRSSHYIFERFTELKNLQIRLQNNVLELEKEKRQQQLECWKDLMSLRRDLMMALREYWDSVRRQEILDLN